MSIRQPFPSIQWCSWIASFMLIMPAFVRAAPEVLWKYDPAADKPAPLAEGCAVVEDAAAQAGKSLRLTFAKEGQLPELVRAGNLTLAGNGTLRVLVRGKDLNDAANGLRLTLNLYREDGGHKRFVADGVVYAVRATENAYRVLPISFNVADKQGRYTMVITAEWQKQNGERKPTVWIGGMDLEANGNSAPYISGLLRSRLIYAPGMRVRITATVVNPTKEAFQGKLTARELFGLNGKRDAAEAAVSLAAGEVRAFDLDWKAAGPETGREIDFALQDRAGKEINRDRIDVGIAKDGRILAFPAHDFEQSGRPYGGALYYVAPASHTQSKAIADFWLRDRTNRGGRMEFFSWSWCDLAGFIPKEDPYLGNFEHLNWLSLKEYKEQVALVKATGTHVDSYILGCAIGEAAYELYQKHPDWFMYDRNGEHLGSYDMEYHARQSRRHEFEFGQPARHCMAASLDPTRPEVRRWIADQIITLGKDMGFDGARWDVWYMEVKPGFYRLDGAEIAPKWEEADRLTAESLKAVKDLVGRELPDFTWGYNFGAPEENKNIPLTLAEKCKGHGWILDETAIDYWRKTSPNHFWSAYSKRMVEWGDHIRQLEGIYDPWIFDRGFVAANPNHIEVDWLHATIFRILAGGRVWIALYKNNSALAGDWPRMAFRFSDTFSGWNLRLQPEDQKAIVVDGPPTLWWKGYVFTNKSPEGKDQTIVHLVNAPVADEVGENRDSKVRPAVLNVKVQCKAVNGHLPQKAWLVMAESMTPDLDPKVQAMPLTLTRQGGDAVTVIVPAVLYLKTVVFEF